MNNQRQQGAAYEEAALRFLQAGGLWITEHNYRCHFGEIDIIGTEEEEHPVFGRQKVIVFVEVKYRKDERMGGALAAVGSAKQKTICKVADYYRMQHHLSEFDPMRFDVVAIDGDRIKWIKDAFPYQRGR
ncbi:MAG: YraN family protein [Lachnospiraceae bacterium]|nr:YraN family protein [Lachnospiraceae bacterium]